MTRSTSDRPPIVAPRENIDSAANTDDTSPTPEPLSGHIFSSESDTEAIEFAEEATNTAAVRRLVAETTYTNESVLLYQRRISECYRLQLNYITRDDGGSPNVQFCRVIRSAEVDCERDAYDHIATVIRLPFPADEFSGFSIGSGGGCDRIPERYRNGSESA
jgi:hypothetical protein